MQACRDPVSCSVVLPPSRALALFDDHAYCTEQKRRDQNVESKQSCGPGLWAAILLSSPSHGSQETPKGGRGSVPTLSGSNGLTLKRSLEVLTPGTLECGLIWR